MSPLPHPSRPRLSQVSARFAYFRRFGLLGVLALLFVALLIGQHLVAGGDPSLEFNAPSDLPPASGLVDQSPLRLARQLAPQAAVPQERQYAQDALRLADSEVDQAFASALRGATQHAPPLTGQALKISQRLNALNDRIKAEQANVTTRQHGPGTADDDPQLQLAQAQLALDTDEADELHQTLIRLGGDRHALIQQALDEHEAVHKQETGAAISQTEALEALEALTSLIGKLHALSSLRTAPGSSSRRATRRNRWPHNSSGSAIALSNDIEDRNVAAREWQHLSQLRGSLSTFSAEPIVELRPIGGLEVVIRYITRAQDRFEMRSRLNQRPLAILDAPQPSAPGDTSPASTLAESAASER